MSDSSTRPRVRAVFGLTLLEALRDQDVPAEFLEDDATTVTMPRRLGLSDVVEKQIRIYRDATKSRRRMSDEQVADLIKLVVRRSDAESVFHRAGVRLHERVRREVIPVARYLPPNLGFRLARRGTEKGLQAIFGRRMGGFGSGPFTFEGRGMLFLEGDPSGQACHFVTGFCQAVVGERVGSEYTVLHTACQAHGDDVCRWTVVGEARQRERDGVREMLLRPELETG